MRSAEGWGEPDYPGMHEGIADIRELVKEKEATEDEARRAEDKMQSYTDARVAEVGAALSAKEADLMEI